MESAIADLKEALRERLAIIHDKESRRNADRHMARLSAVSEKIDKLQAVQFLTTDFTDGHGQDQKFGSLYFSIRIDLCNPRFLNQWKTRLSIQGAAVSSPPK